MRRIYIYEIVQVSPSTYTYVRYQLMRGADFQCNFCMGEADPYIIFDDYRLPYLCVTFSSNPVGTSVPFQRCKVRVGKRNISAKVLKYTNDF